MKEKLLTFFKKETILCIACLLAALSAYIVPPDAAYLGYVDTRVLILLFSLMAVLAGFRALGIFDRMANLLLARAKKMRQLALTLVMLCFFSAMLVTNDVALLTFVPLTLLLFRDIGDEKSRIRVIVLETAAANLGSMMTPVGNPQNLYLYAAYQLHTGDFFRTMLPAGVLSWLVLLGLSFLLPKTPCAGKPGETTLPVIPKKPAAVYLLLFLVCLLTVFRVIPDWLCLVLTAVLVFFCDKKLFAQADYCLLGTFVCFFVFVGNIARVDAVRAFFAGVMQGRELWVSAALSQCISNVPAAVMLSGFTENAKALLLGVNLGGLGTPIASLASLISYQFYSKAAHSRPGKYLGIFSAVNFGMLAVLLAVGWLQLRFF